MGYTPKGRAHRILERLATGEAFYPDLLHVVGRGKEPNKHKLNLLINAMSRDCLLVREGFIYALGRNGRAALDDLRAGYSFTHSTPSVRVFVRAAA